VLRYITVKVYQFEQSSNKNRRDERSDKPEVVVAATEETEQ
jgi:hypothetical protein